MPLNKCYVLFTAPIKGEQTTVTEAMKNDIAVAQRLGITATTLEGILTVKGQGRR